MKCWALPCPDPAAISIWAQHVLCLTVATEQADFSLPSMECKEPILAACGAGDPTGSPGNAPEVNLQSCFPDWEVGWGACGVLGTWRHWGLWPRPTGEERQDSSGPGRRWTWRRKGPCSGASWLTCCKPEQKLFVSYQKSPSLSRVKVRKSIPFGFQLAGCGDRGGSPPRDGSLEIPSCCFNGSPGFRSG